MCTCVVLVRDTKPVQIYRGENAVYKFLEQMLNEVKCCKSMIKYRFNKPLKMTKIDEEKFQTRKRMPEVYARTAVRTAESSNKYIFIMILL